MVIRWRVLGWDVLSLELHLHGESEVPDGITGGSGGSFERLPEEPYYEEHAFGFRVNTAPH